MPLRPACEDWCNVCRPRLPMLVQMGIDYTSISPHYTFPNGGKADLCIKNIGGIVVFELKTFISGQDSNKIEKYK